MKPKGRKSSAEIVKEQETARLGTKENLRKRILEKMDEARKREEAQRK